MRSRLVERHNTQKEMDELSGAFLSFFMYFSLLFFIFNWNEPAFTTRTCDTVSKRFPIVVSNNAAEGEKADRNKHSKLYERRNAYTNFTLARTRKIWYFCWIFSYVCTSGPRDQQATFYMTYIYVDIKPFWLFWFWHCFTFYILTLVFNQAFEYY